MDLNQKKRDALDARLKSEIDGHCALDETRAALEEAFQKESDMYIGHLQAGQKAMEALSEVYENGLSENAVYQGTYHNEPEKKKDALEAISFANSCSQIRDVLLRSAVSFGAQGLQRMSIEAKRGKLNDEKIVKAKEEIAKNQAAKDRKNILGLIPLLLGIFFFFVPLLLRPVIPPHVDDYFYYGSFPKVIWYSLFIFIGGEIILSLILHFKETAERKKCAEYLDGCEIWKDAVKKEEELNAYYQEKSAAAKKDSDKYFELISGSMVGKLIDGIYLAPIPAEFRSSADLTAAQQLLGSSRAETLKDVYDILERRHAQDRREQAEAQHRANMENINLEKLRSQQRAEEYAKQQADYAKQQANYAREQADYAKQQAAHMKDLARESEKQTEYARQQAEDAARMQSDIDYMKRNN